MDWLPWLMGGSTIALLVLAVVAPSVLQVAATWLSALSPLVKGVAEGIVAFARVLWSGIQDIIDNWKTIVTVATLTVVAVWYFQPEKVTCPQCSEPTVCKPSYSPTKPKTYKAPASQPKSDEDVMTIIKRQLGL